MRTFWQTIVAILRELADENAYRRFLLAEGSPPSREAWQRFCDCRLKAKYSRAKCC